MDDGQAGPGLAKFYGPFDLPAIAGVGPARVAVSADDEIRDLCRQGRDKLSAQARDLLGKLTSRVPRRGASEAGFRSCEHDVRADRAKSHYRTALENRGTHDRSFVQDGNELREEVLETCAPARQSFDLPSRP